MRSFIRWLGTVVVIWSVTLLAAADARAACTINSMSLVSSGVANAGTYTQGGSQPGAQTVSVQVSLSHSGSGGCQGAVAFARASSATGTMTRVGGGSGTITVPYSLTSGGTNTIYLSGGTPAANNFAAFTISSGDASPVTKTVTLSLTATYASTNVAGDYRDNLTVNVFNRNGGNISGGAVTGGAAFSVEGLVNGGCSMVGAASNTSQTVAVNTVGQTTGMATAAPQFNITCVSASTVSLTSTNGAVTRGNVLEGSLPTAPTGFRNKIEYTASIDSTPTTVQLNTDSVSSTSGTFAAAAVTNRLTTVTISPNSSTTPLQQGTYNDVLTIVIAPQ